MESPTTAPTVAATAIHPGETSSSCRDDSNAALTSTIFTKVMADGGLPVSHNPAAGFFATANAMTLPADWKGMVGYEWADPTRAIRIHEGLQLEP